MRKVIRLLSVILLCSCSYDKTDLVNINKVDTTDKKISNIDSRIIDMVNFYCKKYDTAIIIYTLGCWINDCSPKGYTYYVDNSSSHLIAFNLKKMYQSLPYNDSVTEIGKLLVFHDLYIDKALSKSFNYSLSELVNNRIPVEGRIAMSHDDTVYIWYKQNNNIKSAITLISTMFHNNLSQHFNFSTAFSKADSMAVELFDNNDTLK
ncbi:hypothetical protein CAP35_01325 [Chitinophagaceae bacterium IBVUCB1]|nr:hypothetical protein CAP35_01325 [Chitinophagaceae bacterium IBVUCB1]